MQLVDKKQNLAADDIHAELERILASLDFEASQRCKDFLRFVVEEKLAGQSYTLKGYTIATHVFGRDKDFNPNLDPIVRIEAGKLRRALERYYFKAGSQDPIHIEIPKGTYIPIFSEQTEIESEKTTGVKDASEISIKDAWPSVLVMPFQNLTGDPDKNYLGLGLATELAVEISRFQEIKVLLYSQEGHDSKVSSRGVRFAIDGNIREDRTGINVTVYMTDTLTSKHIWGDTHQSNLEAAQMIAFQEEIARTIAAKITSEQGIIAKTLSLESRKKPPSELATYEAILQFYEYDRTYAPESFKRALEALEYAKVIEPECSQVWTFLGRLYGNIYSLDFPGFENPLEKAITYAEKGVHLTPDNQKARSILAFVRMFSNEIPAALAEVERAFTLNPNSLIFLEGIGYLMTLLGEWERGPALIRKVIRLNPYYLPVVHYALWANWIRQKKYEEAHLETLEMRRPALFWNPLVKAATYGLLGKHEKGKHAVEDLLKLKPDFPSRGRVLIGHYIKFDDIVERVVEGLSKAGLKVE
jgi:adenylate cyclase